MLAKTQKNSRTFRLVFLIFFIPLILACKMFQMEYCIATGGEWVLQEDEKTGDVQVVCDYSQPSDTQESLPGEQTENPADAENKEETGPAEEQAEGPAGEGVDESAGEQAEAPAPSGSEGDLTLEQCLLPTTAYSWAYENVDQSGGTGGGYCHADFVMTNNSNEPIFIMAYDVFDNNAMENSNYWRQWSLEPGAQHEEKTSYAWRPDDPDGDTFTYFSKVLGVRKVNACVWLVVPGQEEYWEDLGLEIPAPCH